MDVKLTGSELYLAAQVGVARQMEAMRKGLPDKHGFDGIEGWTVHIEGAAGEVAVAKALGVYWNGSLNTFKSQADVQRLEVRTRSKSYYELLIRPDDDSKAVFVLVTGRAPDFEVRGWIQGSEAKKDEWLQTYGGRPPAYFVPHDALHPISELSGPSITYTTERSKPLAEVMASDVPRGLSPDDVATDIKA